MTFVQIETRNGMVNLDGYSRNKTLKGALKDLAREVAKIDKTEADGILNNIDEMAGMATDMMNIPNEWYIEAQEVHCASRRSEKSDEMEYAEGHWYLYIRFCAPEQENDEPETPSTDGTAHETETNDMVMKCEMKQCEGCVQNEMPGGTKIMKKDVLKTIKNDMRGVRENKKYLQSELKSRLTELETDRKIALAENAKSDASEISKKWFNRLTNDHFDRRRQEVISNEYSQWHNDQMYHLIYKDGSEVVISAEDILGGEKFPKMSDIVYAEMSSADDHMDTETGDIYWYSEERMEACDWNYDVENEARWQYETAIQYKFGTEWAKRWSQRHPEFVPMTV